MQAIQNVPDLKPLLPNVIFDETEDGLRIQIIDQEGQSMFSTGSAVVEGRIRNLLLLIGQAMVQLPNHLIISGHTEAVPFANEHKESGYGNWELSADRANATRRIFRSSGPPERVDRVSGLASTDPYDAENPKAPTNRRISVVLAYLKAPAASEIEANLSEAEERAVTTEPQVAPPSATKGHGTSTTQPHPDPRGAHKDHEGAPAGTRSAH